MKHKVLIMRCDEYDPARIASIVREGMEELEVRPHGKVLLKPNVVIAHPEIFPHAFTRSEFLEGVIAAVKDRALDLDELAVGERSGITVPTRFCFDNAGYPPVLERYGVKTYFFDETPHAPVPLSGTAPIRNLVYLPRPVADCDFFINLPKFKAHPWTRLTLSIKNLIGLQDDRFRLLDHNTYLEHKIADLHQAVSSGFIAVDGIAAGQKMMLTPTPFHLGAIIMGTNSCAVDAVCCRMVNVDPVDVKHLDIASRRGLGPVDMHDIEVAGDFALHEVQERTRNFQFVLERVDRYFDETNLRCTVGSFPENHSADYCWGGCPGALQEAVHILKGFTPDALARIKKIRYVVGRVEGPLDLEKDERVIFAGACTSWEGTINGRKVRIDPTYRSSPTLRADDTKSNDMLLKTGQSLWRCARSAGSGYIHAPGCPVSVADHVNYLSYLGGLPNPNFDRRMLLPLNAAYLRMRAHRAWNRFSGLKAWLMRDFTGTTGRGRATRGG